VIGGLVTLAPPAERLPGVRLASLRCGGDPLDPLLARLAGGRVPAARGPPVTPPRGGLVPGDPRAALLARLGGQPQGPGPATPEPARYLGALDAPDPARSRPVGGLPLPPQPPLRAATTSALTLAGRHYARATALAFASGDDPNMALRCEVASLLGVAEALNESSEYGVNSNTLKKDERAWELWEFICEQLGTSPLRTAADALARPERNAFLLAVLMLTAMATCRPRQPERKWIKPKSALAYPLAIIRVFGRWGVAMPSYKLLKAQVAGLSRQYIIYHGPYSLAPRRAEPMKFSMVRSMDQIPCDGRRIGSFSWSDADHHVFVFRRLNRFMIKSAMRLGEVVAHTSGEIMYVSLESLSFRIRGVHLTNPTEGELRSMPRGSQALVAPARAKPDQWGEIHCPFPLVFTYDPDDDLDVAGGLRDLELRAHELASASSKTIDRRSTPLFGDAAGRPYTHGFMDAMLKAVLTYLYGAGVASLYTWHSYRSGLATALHAAEVPDAMIQLICRWMCPESLHIYRRMGTREHEQQVAKAAHCNVDLIQSTNVPRVAMDGCYSALVDDMLDARSSKVLEREFEQASRRCLEPFAADDDQRESRPPAATPAVATERQLPPEASQPAQRPGPKLSRRPAMGDEVLVPREIWPSYSCAEHDGAGWHAQVRNATALTVCVRFTHARTQRGKPYEDVRLPWPSLRSLEPSV
jgi:hypothetical protein